MSADRTEVNPIEGKQGVEAESGPVTDKTQRVVLADGHGLATEATLALLKARADLLATEATLLTRASEATLLLIKAKTDNLDVALATRASEATLAAANKEEDSAHVSGDTGRFVLGVANQDEVARVSDDSDYTPISTDEAGRIITRRGAPVASILNGSRVAATAGTIIVVPANKVWTGTIATSVSKAAAIGDAAASGSAVASWAPGTGGTPAVQIAPSVWAMPAVGALVAVGQSANNGAQATVSLYAGTTAGTLTLATTGTAPTLMGGSATGVLEDA